MSSVNKESFISSFTICIHFVSFSSLIALAKTISMLLKRNGERDHPFLVSDFNGKALSFSPFSGILALSFLYIFFIKFNKKFPCIHSLLRVLIE